jgi:hypothetical protein
MVRVFAGWNKQTCVNKLLSHRLTLFSLEYVPHHSMFLTFIEYEKYTTFLIDVSIRRIDAHNIYRMYHSHFP